MAPSKKQEVVMATVENLDLAKIVTVYSKAYDHAQRTKATKPYEKEKELTWFPPSFSIPDPSGKKCSFEQLVLNQAKHRGFEIPYYDYKGKNYIDYRAMGFGVQFGQFGPVITFDPDYKRPETKKREKTVSSWSW